MEASQHPFEPLLLERPEHAHRTAYEFSVDGVRARIYRDDLARLVVHPHEPTVEITSLDPLGTQLAARVAIGITTRILG
jgi:hypothetical protein